VQTNAADEFTPRAERFSHCSKVMAKTHSTCLAAR
jgi:hypothetical protein